MCEYPSPMEHFEGELHACAFWRSVQNGAMSIGGEKQMDRDNAIWLSMRTKDEQARDEKYDIHAAGDCEWETCEWCIAAELEAKKTDEDRR